ncbi:hypothetical protein CDAR_244741 [Caerostris darwini]|uniref:Uncharacterized protein n=1 Tax=Caerostris darwini TaxID=1538125 RepID=A0AAV4MM49_9ARAC|nr:hypothetical protein CDAR_244741 [Caerostris darwini]
MAANSTLSQSADPHPPIARHLRKHNNTYTLWDDGKNNGCNLNGVRNNAQLQAIPFLAFFFCFTVFVEIIGSMKKRFPMLKRRSVQVTKCGFYGLE